MIQSVQSGLKSRRGCVKAESPLSFNLYWEKVMRDSADIMAWIGVQISGSGIVNVRYADDIVVIATLPKKVQQLLSEVDKVTRELNYCT